jgi:hypothetical protein
MICTRISDLRIVPVQNCARPFFIVRQLAIIIGNPHPKATYNFGMSQAERDAIDIFWLLYPLLDDGNKDTSEGRKALGLAEKYREFSRDSGKIEGYDRIVRIVKDQLRREADPEFWGELRGPVTAARADAYAMIVRQLGIAHELNEFYKRPTQPVAELAPPKRKARKSAAKKASSRARKPTNPAMNPKG